MTEELLKEIRRVSEALLTDGALQNERNNKAAGVRARKASLELERLTKAFRKASLETDKERGHLSRHDERRQNTLCHRSFSLSSASVPC